MDNKDLKKYYSVLEKLSYKDIVEGEIVQQQINAFDCLYNELIAVIDDLIFRFPL